MGGLPVGLEVKDVEPADLDQDGVDGQGLASRVGLDPGVVAFRPARDLAELLGQLPLLLVEPCQLPLAVALLAGPGGGEGQGGQAVADVAEPGHELGRGGVFAAAGQQGALGQRLLRQALAVEQPPGRPRRRRAVVGAAQCHRQRDVQIAFIGGLEEDQLFLLGEGGQDADDVSQDRAASAVGRFHRVGPVALRHVEEGQVVQAGGDSGVVGPELCFPDLEAALKERLGLRISALQVVQNRQVTQAGGQSGVVGSELRLPDLEAAFVERLGLRISALQTVQFRQVVQAGGDIGVVGPELRFPDLEAAFVERLGLRISALILVQFRQVVQAGGDIGVVGPELRFSDLEAAFVERLGLRISALILVQFRQVVQAGGDIGVVGPELRLGDLEAPLVEWLGLRISALQTVQFRQVVQAGGDIGVVGPELRF